MNRLDNHPSTPNVARKLPGANLAIAEQEAHDLARVLYAEHYSTPLDAAGPDTGEVYVRRAMGELARRRDAVKAERAACIGDIEHEVSANGSGSREGVALHAAATRIQRRAERGA